MKKIIFTLAIMLVGFTSMANAPLPTETIISGSNILDSPSQLFIALEANDQTQYFEFSFETAEALENFDITSISDSIVIYDVMEVGCTVSITVKVRFGIDSNFVEASATISDIPCDKAVAAIKKLRAQILAGIQ